MFFDLNTSIQKVKDYFVSFNISENTAYVLVRFPEKWIVATSLEEYGINTSKDPETGGYYFFCQYENLDKLFTAIEETVNANKEMAEKQALFMQRANELQELFAKKTLAELKRLRFTFEPQKKEFNQPKDEDPPLDEYEKKENNISGEIVPEVITIQDEKQGKKFRKK